MEENQVFYNQNQVNQMHFQNKLYNNENFSENSSLNEYGNNHGYFPVYQQQNNNMGHQ